MATDEYREWNRQYQRHISTRLDSSAAIRGQHIGWAMEDETENYRNWYSSLYASASVVNGAFNIPPSRTSPGIFVHDEIIDAEWHDVVDNTRIDRWNTIWTDIGQAYNKKVHCIEG